MSVNRLSHRIAEAISPYVGQMMARSSIELHCKRLGYDPENLQRGQLESLLKQLALGLNIFIGRDKTEKVMHDIRLSLARTTE